jgi:predicted metal-dependent HD superfamily phosphohydrolase
MLKEVFNSLVSRYSSDRASIDKLWDEIEKQYAGKKRYYHNLSHLESLMNELILVRPLIQHWDDVMFSLFYHDIVYNPLKRDNEERSAALARERLLEINIPTDARDRIYQHIVATRSHALSSDPDTNLFTDADLSILGYDADTYTEYTQQIRKEYLIYPDLIYKPGRKKVLNHFLAMPRLFKTDHFFKKYERQARENLAAELKTL